MQTPASSLGSRERRGSWSEQVPNELHGHSTDTPFSGSAFDCSNPLKGLERVKGIGPSTRSLGSYCSTTELHPRSPGGLTWRKAGLEGKIGLTIG